MTNWLITNMDQETKKAIKDQAKAYGCTIPYLLSLTFKDKEMPQSFGSQSAWTIHGFTSQDISAIQRQAKSQGNSIASFLKNQIEIADEKIIKKTKARKIINEMVKALYDME